MVQRTTRTAAIVSTMVQIMTRTAAIVSAMVQRTTQTAAMISAMVQRTTRTTAIVSAMVQIMTRTAAIVSAMVQRTTRTAAIVSAMVRRMSVDADLFNLLWCHLQKSALNISKIPSIILSVSYRGVKFIDAKSQVAFYYLITKNLIKCISTIFVLSTERQLIQRFIIVNNLLQSYFSNPHRAVGLLCVCHLLCHKILYLTIFCSDILLQLYFALEYKVCHLLLSKKWLLAHSMHIQYTRCLLSYRQMSNQRKNVTS